MSEFPDLKTDAPRAGQTALLVVAWLWAGIPLAWGVYATVVKSVALFK